MIWLELGVAVQMREVEGSQIFLEVEITRPADGVNRG